MRDSPSPAPATRGQPEPWGERFRRLAQGVSQAVGSPVAFVIAVAVIVVWGVSGPEFHYSDTWQLIINTGTTIVTFLMVFMIQSTQNRDARAIHLKLDELIRSARGARNRLVDLEHCSDAEMAEIEAEFAKVKEKAARAKHKADRLGDGALEHELSDLERAADQVGRAVQDKRRAG
jgi:low affinity Fe/Cu permease